MRKSTQNYVIRFSIFPYVCIQKDTQMSVCY
ncbi:hypothetical protein [Lactococcus phage PMBT68]|nr:hypothetical protein [Lactococcus phage P1411]